MVLTQCSIIFQPNRVFTQSYSSLVPVLFSLTEHNTKSYYSIKCHSGFHKVCPDSPIFSCFLYILIFWQPIYDYWLVLSSLISPLQFFGLIPWFPKLSPVYVNYRTMVHYLFNLLLFVPATFPRTLRIQKNVTLPSPCSNCSIGTLLCTAMNINNLLWLKIFMFSLD